MFENVTDGDVPRKRSPAMLPEPCDVPSEAQYRALTRVEVHEKVTDGLESVEPGFGLTVSTPSALDDPPNLTVMLSSAVPPAVLVQVRVYMVVVVARTTSFPTSTRAPSQLLSGSVLVAVQVSAFDAFQKRVTGS